MFAAAVLVALFEAARRPLGWALVASVLAWLLSWVIGLLDRWIPRGIAIAIAAVGFGILLSGAWVGVSATIQSEVGQLRTDLPRAARDLEQRYEAVAEFRLSARAEAFVTSLHDRFGTRAQVAEAAGTVPTYLVIGILMLFLVGYGPRYISAGLGQISDPVKRESAAAILDRASRTGRAYLLVALAQVIVVTAICSLVFYLLDLPAPFVLGLLVGSLGAIPYLGILIGGLAPLIAAATNPNRTVYLVLTVLLVGLQLVEALVVRRRVDRHTLRVGPAVALIGAIIGYGLYGLGGAIYGAAALVFLWALLQAMPDRSAGAPAPPPPPVDDPPTDDLPAEDPPAAATGPASAAPDAGRVRTLEISP